MKKTILLKFTIVAVLLLIPHRSSRKPDRSLPNQTPPKQNPKNR